MGLGVWSSVGDLVVLAMIQSSFIFQPFLTWKCSKKDAKWATDAKRYGFHNWIFNSKEDHNFLSNSKSQILAKTREQIVRNSDKIVTKDIKMI